MELVVLGSGTALPHPSRGAPGHAVRLPEGWLLLDTGPGTHRRWPAAGIDAERVRWIATTHHHVDHTADLPAILFALAIPGVARPEALTLFGPPGHAEFLRALDLAWGDSLEPEGTTREVRELATDGRPELFASGSIAARSVAHGRRPAVGYRIEAEGRTIAYGGDSGPCDALVDLCRDADVALLDCSTPDEIRKRGHMTAGEAGTVAARAGVRCLVLCHLYPECDGVDVASQAARRFAGDIIVAQDGLRLAL